MPWMFLMKRSYSLMCCGENTFGVCMANGFKTHRSNLGNDLIRSCRNHSMREEIFASYTTSPFFFPSCFLVQWLHRKHFYDMLNWLTLSLPFVVCCNHRQIWIWTLEAPKALINILERMSAVKKTFERNAIQDNQSSQAFIKLMIWEFLVFQLLLLYV
jgi:hypothetical protein